MANSKLTQEQSDFIEKSYAKNVLAVYRLVCSMTHGWNKIDKEAVVQDTFTVAVQKVEHLMKHPAPVQWLMATARNKIMDEMKRKSNFMEDPVSYEELDEYESPILSMNNSFSDFADALTSEEIALLKKHWEEGYTLSEIADMKSVKPGTLRMRMSRIYSKIKKSKMFI